MTTNLIPNPSYETDLNHWLPLGAGNITGALSTIWAKVGAQSVLLTASADEAGAVQPLRSDLLPCDPNAPFSVGVWLAGYDQQPPPTLALVVQAFDAGGGFLASVVTTSVALPGDGSPIRVKAEGVVWPSNTAQYRVVVYHAPSAPLWPAGAGVYVDAWQAVEASTLPDYFDGDTPDDDTYHYAWTGTPHNSTSTKSLWLKGAVHLDRATLTEVVEDPNTEARYVVAGTSGSVGGGNGKVDALTLDGEFRSYGNGFTRLITGSGSTRTQTLALRALTPDQIEVVKALVGHKVLYRDTYGRRIFGGFLGWSITNIAFSGGLADVGLVIQTVSHDEEV